MAVLNKIRQRSIFLIAIIALALFSFVLSDLFRNSSAFTGSQDVIASIDGTDINREDFMGKVEMAQRQMGPNGTSTQAMNRVWDQEVRKAVLQKQFEELGLTVEKDQMRELLKQNLASLPDFSNEAGVFDENKLNEFIANLKAINPNRAPIGSSMINYDEWVDSEKSIAISGQQQSYFNMIKAGIASTIGEAEVEYNLENETVDLKYVEVAYTTIADSLVNVSKSEISSYINDHKKKFEVEASRDINFVEFQEVASGQDEEEVKVNVLSMLNNKVEYNEVTKLNDTVVGFKNTTDIEGYINTYSDMKYADTFVKKESLPSTVQDTIFKLNVGQYFGPYTDAGMVKITKVIAEKDAPDSAKVRHILIPFVGGERADPLVSKTDEEAKKTADSILSVIKSKKAKFVDLLELSSDKVSNEKQGEIEFAYTDGFAPEFKEFSFNNNPGSIDVVKTSFGYHIIEVLSQTGKTRFIKLATLAQKIEPSERTIDAAFNNVSNFEIAIQDKEFQKAAKEKNLQIKPVNGVKELDENIPGLGSQRAIVRWAFEDGTNIGDTKRFSIPTGGYVVAQVSAINKKGLMSVEAASATVIPEIRKEKKAKMIKDGMKGKTVDEVAKNKNLSVMTATAVNMKNPTLASAGVEPKVVGSSFGLKVGQSTGLIDGEKGVYMVTVTNKTQAPKLDNYQAVANRLTTARANESQIKVFNALKEASDIEDHRAKFY